MQTLHKDPGSESIVPPSGQAGVVLSPYRHMIGLITNARKLEVNNKTLPQQFSSQHDDKENFTTAI
jgi:hypothetical protein